MFILKLLIYIAGPYSSNPCHGTRAALDAAEVLVRDGYTPFVPHMSLLWDIAYPHPPKFWYDLDMEYLDHCDLLLRLPGTSWGCDRECEFCEAHDIPVFRGTAEQFVKAGHRPRALRGQASRKGARLVKRRRLTNKRLTGRIIELGALLGAVQGHFLDFRSGVNRDLDNAIERIADLETLHYKGKYPEAHNYPEPVHNETTTKEREE